VTEIAEISIQQPVDRARRHRFISRVTLFCLGTMAIFAAMSGFGWIVTGPVMELYMGAASTLVLTTVAAYVTGSVIDYNGGIGNMLKSKD